MENRWYCLHTRPRKEGRVAGHLREALGLESYFPRLRRERTIRRVKRTVIEPLFPRYLFCRFDFAHRYRAVQYAPDVLEIVSFGGVPAAVEETLIADLKGWAGEILDLAGLRPGLRPGDRVEITDGPLRGLQAVILSAGEGRERVAIVLSILERSVEMKIGRHQLARVE